MNTPTFKMLGSKCRTAPWICDELARTVKRFDRWIEPFAGRGNMFFRAATTPNLHFESCLLNDPATSDFLTALRDHEGGFEFVDSSPITSELVSKWERSTPGPERALAASYLVRLGMFWPEHMNGKRFGPNTTCDKNKHSRDNTIERMKLARRLLREYNAEITDMDWLEFLESIELRGGDVVYFDPPYNVTFNAGYENINHEKFVEKLVELDRERVVCVVSGYDSDLYDSALGSWKKITRERASTAQSVISRKKPKATEVVWHNVPMF